MTELLWRGNGGGDRLLFFGVCEYSKASQIIPVIPEYTIMNFLILVDIKPKVATHGM